MPFAPGKPYRWDSNKKHKLRLAFCMNEEEVDVPKVLSPLKAANEAAKMDLIEAAARAKMADFTSRVTALVPGAPVPAMGTPPAPAPVATPAAPPVLSGSAPPAPAPSR